MKEVNSSPRRALQMASIEMLSNVTGRVANVFVNHSGSLQGGWRQ